MFGVTLLDCGEFTLSVTANKWVSCAFSGCGMITHDNGAELRMSSIAAAIGTGIELIDPPTNPEFREVSLQNNPVGIRISSNGTYDLRAISFAGNDIDIEVVAPFASGQSVDINILEDGDTPVVVNNGAATVNVTVSASHTLTGLQQNTEVTYVDTSDGTTVLYHVENVDSSGETEYNYNAASPKTADILIHHVNYVPILLTNISLGAAGGEIPIIQQIDRVYENQT